MLDRMAIIQPNGRSNVGDLNRQIGQLEFVGDDGYR
jgi:hypothetical protein